jgi:hypothetical protein
MRCVLDCWPRDRARGEDAHAALHRVRHNIGDEKSAAWLREITHWPLLAISSRIMLESGRTTDVVGKHRENSGSSRAEEHHPATGAVDVPIQPSFVDGHCCTTLLMPTPADMRVTDGRNNANQLIDYFIASAAGRAAFENARINLRLGRRGRRLRYRVFVGVRRDGDRTWARSATHQPNAYRGHRSGGGAGAGLG